MAKANKPPRQFIGVTFGDSSVTASVHTYHNDGALLSVGDRPKIFSREGWTLVTVVEVSDTAPDFETKPLPIVDDARTDAAETPAGMGHNRPPAYDPKFYEVATARVSAFADAAGDWLDLETIDDEETAGKLVDYIAGTRKLLKEIDDRRVAEKKPHLDAGREVDAAFADLKNPLEKAVAKTKKLLNAFVTAKEAAAREREREEQLRLQRERDEIERKAREATKRNDLIAEAEAEKAAKAIDTEAKQVAKVAADAGRVGSFSGGTKRAGLATVRSVKIISIRQALLYYLEHPEIADTVLRIANAEIRAAKGADITIPGIEIVTERKIR